MSVSKLSDILPVTTMDPLKAKSKLKPGRKPRKASAKSISKMYSPPGKIGGPWPMTPGEWMKTFYEFLKFCGWTVDNLDDEKLNHPTHKDICIWSGEFQDDDDEMFTEFEINIDTAHEWYADDVKNVLFKKQSIGQHNTLNYRLEIMIK